MEKEYINGQMEEVMKANIFLIKSMDLENICGVMEKFIKDFGKMVISMEKGKLLILMAK